MAGQAGGERTGVNAEIQIGSLLEASEEGDTINFDYSGSIDGQIFEGGTATGQTATLGNGGWIDGFEEGLIGKPCGEEFTIEAYFPDDYSNAELSGQGFF